MVSIRLHRFTVIVACATFLLIVAGALVTSNDAGLAAPDWPLSYGQVFPRMVGNLFWEHGHRLIAASVGALVVALNIWMHIARPPAAIRRLGLIALGLVIAQGLLGGLTVRLQLPLPVSAAHATLAQLFFCTAVTLAVVTSPGWNQKRLNYYAGAAASSPKSFCVIACAAVFLQLIIGAVLRHSATWDQPLPAPLLLTHIGGALLVSGAIVAALFAVWRHQRDSYLLSPAKMAGFLLVVQIGLGIAAYVTRRDSPAGAQPLNPMVGVTVAHVACGALLFATVLVLALRVFHVTGRLAAFERTRLERPLAI